MCSHACLCWFVVLACKEGLKALCLQVNYINAHATSTLVGDVAEIKAVKSAFPDLSHMKINGTKSMIGHCLGAAGGMEAIATLKAIQTGWVHPTLNQVSASTPPLTPPSPPTVPSGPAPSPPLQCAATAQFSCRPTYLLHLTGPLYLAEMGSCPPWFGCFTVTICMHASCDLIIL